MKKILLIAFSAILFVSCSNDDNGGGTSTGAIYLPLSVGNYWNYDVTATTSGRDSLFVSSTYQANGNTYNKMETGELPFGFYSGSLRNNGVRNDNGFVLVSGTAGLNLGDAFPINIALDDFIILRENASPNQQLSSLSGEIEQEFEGFPLKITYTLKSTALENLSSYDAPNGQTYQDVKSVKLALNLKITTTTDAFGFPLTIPILNSQDVAVSTMYFAKDIGMVYATTQISYNLEDLSQAGVTLPIPQNYSEIQLEVLDTFVAE